MMSSPLPDEKAAAPFESNIIATSAGDTIVNESQLKAEQDKQFFCGNQTQGPSYFIKEYKLPTDCSQPLGLTVDKDNNIWIASGKTGSLLVFNPAIKHI